MQFYSSRNLGDERGQFQNTHHSGNKAVCHLLRMLALRSRYMQNNYIDPELKVRNGKERKERDEINALMKHDTVLVRVLCYLMTLDQ